MKRKLRVLLGAALLLTLAAAYFAPQAGSSGVELSARAQSIARRTTAPVGTSTASPRSTATQAVDVLQIRPREASAGDDDALKLFGTTRWAVPPKQVTAPIAVSPAPEPVAAPQAPAVPFRVLGRYVENGQVAVFLMHNDQNLVVRVGDTIAEQYRVESLNGAILTLRYLPMNIQQTLDTGGSN